MAREVTLAVQSTLHRAHLPIPSQGLPAPSSAGLPGPAELGDGAGPCPSPWPCRAVRRSEGVSVLSRVKELHQTPALTFLIQQSPGHMCCAKSFVSTHIQNLLVCRVTDRSSGTLRVLKSQDDELNPALT